MSVSCLLAADVFFANPANQIIIEMTLVLL